MSTFFDQLVTHTQHLLDQQKVPAGAKILIGLSGGPDSVFLLMVLHALAQKKGITLTAAHLNHGWRKESDNEALFCHKLCTKLNINFIEEHAKNIKLKQEPKGSKEALGRELRRAFFTQLTQQQKFSYIALAHHYNDQQETFFIRLLRGTTLTGLCSMKSIDGIYLRPLLETDKIDIINYLDTHNIDYCQDATNHDDSFLRNRIRKYLIPAIQQCDNRFDTTFTQLLHHLNEENQYLNQITKKIFTTVFTDINGQLTGSLSIFFQQNPVIQKRLLIEWLITHNVTFTISSSFLKEILRFLRHQQGGQHQILKNWSINKKKDTFWIIYS